MQQIFRIAGNLALSVLLVIGVSSRAFGISWDDVGRVAAFVVTSGWSEVVLELIRTIDGARENIRKQLDTETKRALQEVTGAVQGQRQIVASAEARVNKALERGRYAYNFYAAQRVPVGERDTQKIAGKATQHKSPHATQLPGGGSLGVEGKAQSTGPRYGAPVTAGQERDVTARDQRSATQTAPPADLALLRDAQNKLETVARDFRQLAGAIRQELELGRVEAHAHVTEINSEVTKLFIGELDGYRASLMVGEAMFNADFARNFEILSRRMGATLAEWDKKAVTIQTSITGPAHEKIRAADAGRTTPIAEWTERFAVLIEAATGKQTPSQMSAAQAKELLRKELGISTVPPLNIRQAAMSKPAKSSSGSTSQTDVVKPGTGTGKTAVAISPYAAQAQQLTKRLEQIYSQMDTRALKAANLELEGEFRGKSPQQVAAKREELLRVAKQRFGAEPKRLQVVEQMINYHSRSRASGAVSGPVRRAPSAGQRQ